MCKSRQVLPVAKNALGHFVQIVNRLNMYTKCMLTERDKMLSTEHRTIITATVPILEQGGEALTRHFYQLLFRDFPK